MVRALLYLRLQSLRNFVLHRIRRLREPKYLIGTAAAAAYLYFAVLRRSLAGVKAVASAPVAAGVGAAVVCTALGALGLVIVAYRWIFPPQKAGLRFSEAEIAFLFPAPVTRRALIHYHLLSAQAAILFTSVLTSLFLNRMTVAGGNRLLGAAGWWVILSVFELVLLGTNLLLARLRESSPRFLLWRAAAVAAILAYAAAVAWSAGRFLSTGGHFLGEPGIDLVAQFGASSPFRWLALPFRVVFGPSLASSPRDFAVALVPALAVIALLYAWVSRSQAHFEEGTIALAERRAALRAAAQRGELPQVRRSKPKPSTGPFRLEPKGPPEIAFLWKNLLSMQGSLVSRRLVVIAIGIGIGLSLSIGPVLSWKARASGFDVYGPMIVVFCGMTAAYTLILGPQIARQDLRTDLANADLLKTYPMEGWRLVLGELLAPTVVLTGVLWCAILGAALAVDAGGRLGWLTPGTRVALALSLALAAPVLCVIQLIVPNAILLLLPGWQPAGRSRGGGIEQFGQRLIFAVVQLLIALLVVVPAAAFAALVVFCAQWLVGIGTASLLAAAVVVPLLSGIAAVGLWFLGHRFERFDLSLEVR